MPWWGFTLRPYAQLQVSGKDVGINSAQDAVELGIGYLFDNDDELNEAHELVRRTETVRDDGPGCGIRQKSPHCVKLSPKVKALHIKTHDIQGQVGKLSGSDQQKIALARWMSTDCDILILNHPPAESTWVPRRRHLRHAPDLTSGAPRCY